MEQNNTRPELVDPALVVEGRVEFEAFLLGENPEAVKKEFDTLGREYMGFTPEEWIKLSPSFIAGAVLAATDRLYMIRPNEFDNDGRPL